MPRRKKTKQNTRVFKGPYSQECSSLFNAERICFVLQQKSSMKDIIPFQCFEAVNIQQETSTSSFSLDPFPFFHTDMCSHAPHIYLYFKAVSKVGRHVKRKKNPCVHKPTQNHFCFGSSLQDSPSLMLLFLLSPPSCPLIWVTGPLRTDCPVLLDV